ncbi:hypothetical protein LSCM1_08118 [Leishmania martiniquensis]|uniref:6-phosphofructo-2-kinase domain-containing protein n=1 Tax=Leishmania martiniquensis TaxID=1580590 RepID=A0A836GT85_9TRYP|nr:hypothetical protein LSCM1_08118 [Leishmania martiniquensis]
MSEAKASPAVAHSRSSGDDDDVVAEGRGDDGHRYYLSPPQPHECGRAGDSLEVNLKSPPSPGDVGLEPPVWCRLSTGSIPARSPKTRAMAGPQRRFHDGSGSESGHDMHTMSGAAGVGNRGRRRSTPATAMPNHPACVRCGSGGAAKAATFSQQHQRHHHRGMSLAHRSVSFASPASPSTSNIHKQSSSGEETQCGVEGICGTGGTHEAIPNSPCVGPAGRHERLPAGVAQYTPVYVKANLMATASPAAAGAAARRSTQRPRRKQQCNRVLTANSQAWHWGAAPAVTAAFQQRQQQGGGRQRRGGHVPARLFSNVPTTAAMGAAVAARAQKSALNTTTAVSTPTAKLPQQLAPPMSSSEGCLRGGASTTESMRTLTYAEEALMPLTGSFTSEGAPSQTSESHVGPETPPLPSACGAAPSHSDSTPHRLALPHAHTQAGRHHLGGLRAFTTLALTDTARPGPPTGSTVTDGAIAAGGAAGQPHMVAVSLTEGSDDSRDDLRRVASFASEQGSSVCSLAASRQMSNRTCPFNASATHEGPVEAAAATMDGTFTSSEAHTTLDTGPAAASGIFNHGGAATEHALSTEHSTRVGGALTVGSPCSCTSSGHGSFTIAGMPASASAAAASAATGGADAESPGAGQRQSTSAEKSVGVGLVDGATMPTDSLTAPSLVAATGSVEASRGLRDNAIAASLRSLTPHQHPGNPTVLAVSASLDQRTTTVTSNSFWSSSSLNVNAVSSSGIASTAGAASGGGGGLVTLASNPSIFPGGSFTIASTTRDPLAASITQQSRSALIAELKRRRQRLQKQLALLQQEATAHNIFALVRASNASQLRYLLQEGLCSVNDRDYNGCTPLHVAAGEGNQTVVRVLLSFSADVLAVDNSGRTPLDCAAANRHSGVARYLLTVIRSTHLSQGGGDGGVISSGGEDLLPEAVRGANLTTDKSSVVSGAYVSQTTSPLGSAPLGVSPLRSAALLRPLSRQQHYLHQQPASSSSAISTPSPPRPPNGRRPPPNLTASRTTTDAESWSDSDVPPPAAVWGAKDAHAGAAGARRSPNQTVAAAGAAATSGVPRASTPKPPRSLAMDNIRGPSSRSLPLLSSSPQRLASQPGAAAVSKSAAGNSSLTGYESPASMLTPRCWCSSIPHGSSPQRPVLLSSLDSTAAAHSRGLIAAESNAGAASTEPSSACSNSSPPQLSAFAAAGISPATRAAACSAASRPMLPPSSSSSQRFSSSHTQESTAPRPSTTAVNSSDTSCGNSHASSGGGHRLTWQAVSQSPYSVNEIKESVSEDASEAATQRPPSRAYTTTPLTVTAAGAVARWHDVDEPLADTDVEDIEDVLLGRRGHLSMRRRRMSHGGLASMSSDSLRSGSPRTLAARRDPPHSFRDCSNFNETGSFPGEVPVTLSSPPARMASTRTAAAAAVHTPCMMSATTGGSAQQRHMFLRPPRHPDSSPAAADRQGAAMAAEADICATNMLRPMTFVAVDANDGLGSDPGSATTPTATAPPATTALVTIPAYSLAFSGPKCPEELTSSTIASCAGSLRGVGAGSSSIYDMGQQSLEEHHHHYRMTVLGMRGNQQQPRGGSGLDKGSTPPLLQPTRDTCSFPGAAAAVAGPAPLSSGGGNNASLSLSSSAAAAATDPTVAAPTPSNSTSTSAAAPAPPASASTAATPAPVNAPELAAAAVAATVAMPTVIRYTAEEQSFLPAEQPKPVDVATLRHSSYTTISDTVSVIVCMVGLPGRGKSFISKRLMRYMNWKGVPCEVFNAGNYRRQLLGVEGTASADFFDPDNPKGAQLRERMAQLACEDLVSFIASHSLAVGILDATNTTRKRREWLSDYFQQEAQRHAVPYRLLFIESVCTDDSIITENILRSKCDNDDFKNVKDVSAVISEFRSRISHYEKVYETLEAEERMPYIKIIDVKHHVILHRVPNGLGSRIAFFLLNLHPIAYPIYVALPGETVGDSKHVYGGEERLTARGEAYAIALKHFIQDRYVPHMVVLHATNYSVLSTLAPLLEGAAEEEGEAILSAPSVTNSPGVSPGDSSGTSKTRTPAAPQQPSAEAAAAAASKLAVEPADAAAAPGSRPLMPRASSEVAQLPSSARTLASAGQRCGSDRDLHTSESRSRHSLLPSRDEGLRELRVGPPSTTTEELHVVAGGKLMHEDDSDQVHQDEEEEIGDEVLCPVPGLDNINFGRFSGHTAAWVKEKYPRLSALLYAVDDGDVMGEARAGAETPPSPSPPPQQQQHRHPSRESSRPADATASFASAGSAKATGSASQHHMSQRNGAFLAAEWLSAPLPPPVHYATHVEAVSHLRRASSGADPRLSYCTQLPNGESYRQVNVRLEPALMAVMRTQSPVFVIAPAVPAEGVLSFFLDVIPELSPTIRIPRGCVVEVGVKDSITVHPLLSDSLPESMTRSPLTELPEIQQAIREVAAASSMERSKARAPASASDSAQPGGCTGGGGDGAAHTVPSPPAVGAG